MIPFPKPPQNTEGSVEASQINRPGSAQNSTILPIQNNEMKEDKEIEKNETKEIKDIIKEYERKQNTRFFDMYSKPKLNANGQHIGFSKDYLMKRFFKDDEN